MLNQRTCSTKYWANKNVVLTYQQVLPLYPLRLECATIRSLTKCHDGYVKRITTRIVNTKCNYTDIDKWKYHLDWMNWLVKKSKSEPADPIRHVPFKDFFCRTRSNPTLKTVINGRATVLWSLRQSSLEVDVWFSPTRWRRGKGTWWVLFKMCGIN